MPSCTPKWRLWQREISPFLHSPWQCSIPQCGHLEAPQCVASMLLEQRVTSPPGNFDVFGVNWGQQGFYHLRSVSGERHWQCHFSEKELFFFFEHIWKTNLFVSKKNFLSHVSEIDCTIESSLGCCRVQWRCWASETNVRCCNWFRPRDIRCIKWIEKEKDFLN